MGQGDPELGVTLDGVGRAPWDPGVLVRRAGAVRAQVVTEARPPDPGTGREDRALPGASRASVAPSEGNLWFFKPLNCGRSLPQPQGRRRSPASSRGLHARRPWSCHVDRPPTFTRPPALALGTGPILRRLSVSTKGPLAVGDAATQPRGGDRGPGRGRSRRAGRKPGEHSRPQCQCSRIRARALGTQPKTGGLHPQA